ncbi:MAG: cupredoxin domain-containing protein [Actinomycetota bacterium]|nr:cupredoxin domain-containing protein [Actinomycetota bacterium]
MLNLASRALLTMTATGVVLAGGYAVSGGDRTGMVLLLFLALAALVAALVTAGGAVPDVAPPVADDAPPPERRAVSPGPVPRGSAWPLAAAAALAVTGVGAAVGVPVVLVGVVLVVVATAGWFARVWSEHPSWTRPVRQRVSTRLLVPVGLPAAAFLLAAVIAVSMSRVLLAVPKDVAVLIALVAAVAILLACAWVASRPRLGASVVLALAVLAGASTVGAGIAGAVAGERHFERHHGEEKVLKVSARQIKFDKDVITVPARDSLTIEFVNHDEGIYHNVAIYEGEGIEAEPVFNGEGFPGEAEREYQLQAPPRGTYTFICDFHPSMKGKFVSEDH